MRKTDTPITFISPPAQHAGKAPCARDQACRASHRALPFGGRRIGRHLAQRRLRVIAARPYADFYTQMKDHVAVKDKLRKVNATRCDLETQASAEPQNFAPIP